jgi:hypothetical protein
VGPISGLETAEAPPTAMSISGCDRIPYQYEMVYDSEWGGLDSVRWLLVVTRKCHGWFLRISARLCVTSRN